MLIQGVITDPQHVHSGVGYYGLSLRSSLATYVHPNELFDGAVTVDTTRSGRGYYPTTWDWQNHPLVLGLYAAHGKTLNFGGVVLQRIRFETSHGKEVGAQNAARLAKSMGANGALVTWIGGGNAFVDVMFTLRACERQGIKAVLITYENGGKFGTDSPVLFNVAEADAAISTGSLDRPIELPAMDKVIGPYQQIKIFPFPGAAPVDAARGAAIGSARCHDRRRGYLGPGYGEVRGLLIGVEDELKNSATSSRVSERFDENFPKGVTSECFYRGSGSGLAWIPAKNVRE